MTVTFIAGFGTLFFLQIKFLNFPSPMCGELVNVVKASVIPVRRSFIAFPIRWVSLIIESAITLIDDGTSARGDKGQSTRHHYYTALYTLYSVHCDMGQ